MENQSRGFVAGLVVGIVASLIGFVLFGKEALVGPPPPRTPEQVERGELETMVMVLQDENRGLKSDVARLERDLAKSTGKPMTRPANVAPD